MYPSIMQLDDAAAGEVARRLRRVEGQLGGVIKMIEDGRECADIVTQLAAASRALDRAGFRLLSAGMRQCITAAATGKPEAMSPEQLERLFLTLA
jgi:DNA-binding FrmR family transcriptional regulator